MRSASAGQEELLRIAGERPALARIDGLKARFGVPEEQDLVEAASFAPVGQADRRVGTHLGLDHGDHIGGDPA